MENMELWKMEMDGFVNVGGGMEKHKFDKQKKQLKFHFKL